ncbi:TMV resistance protein N-like [Pyrus ussuriensis x Pyrus communis]|uniref:TMV resistance protein N-like n=1 Tax=Pyrus ussuriensis x Pyrus communis TaxID=2448454 RepID=A0A5N5I431_9ROSA|nr:TMV resistance protein N-like [Pyrus ussuriensis x Pyrus communis]
MQANPVEWIFLVSSLCMEILSAACDQASSPSTPRYSLFGMLLAIAALLTCIWELIYKGRKKDVGWRKRGCYMLFGYAIETYGLVGGIAQCVCSIIQYVYYIRRADTPIKMSLLPAIFLICLITARLSRKQMQTIDETNEHINTEWYSSCDYTNGRIYLLKRMRKRHELRGLRGKKEGEGGMMREEEKSGTEMVGKDEEKDKIIIKY